MSKAKDNSYVFVYGSLKSGFGNHSVMQAAGGVYIGTAHTKHNYTMLDLGGFPGVLERSQNYKIHGELYLVEILDPLDWLEGAPDFYYRKLVEIVVKVFKDEVTAWMYFLNNASEEYTELPYMKEGVWQ